MNDHARITPCDIAAPTCAEVAVEIYVQPGFNSYEFGAVTEVLRLANRAGSHVRFVPVFLSERAGLIDGSGGGLVRARRAPPDGVGAGLADLMLVLGRTGPDLPFDTIMKRIRRMQRYGGQVVLFSSAATAYIISAGRLSHPVTTHWRDAAVLAEHGDYPTLRTTLAEGAPDVITAAGKASVPDILLKIIGKWLRPEELIEIENEMILPRLRPAEAEQPSRVGFRDVRLPPAMALAIKRMEDCISEPMAISKICDEVGLSRRQMERLFKRVLRTTPARFYRSLRVRHARNLVEKTDLSLLEIAVATGYSCTSGLAHPFRLEFGKTPSEFRSNLTRSQAVS